MMIAETQGHFLLICKFHGTYRSAPQKLYQNQMDMKAVVEIDKLIEDCTMGRGIVSLVDKELKELLGVEGPYMRTRVYNTRVAEEEEVKKLWRKMGRGNHVQSLAMEHEVIVGVLEEKDVMEEWSKEWNEGVVWSEKGKKTYAVLINGNHRLELVKTFLMGRGLTELERYVKDGKAEKADKIRAELRLKAAWTARLINLGNIF